jgi:hypothetical protein
MRKKSLRQRMSCSRWRNNKIKRFRFRFLFLPDLSEMGEIRHFGKKFRRIPDEKSKPKFEIWNEKWPKFER